MKPTHARKANIIYLVGDDGKLTDPTAHKSINAAKRASRDIQKGKLGQGLLFVVRR